MRYFDNQKLELLAPAGNFEIFTAINKTSCDAIYFGGKILNMRMIRKGYNFSNEEIKEAITQAHEKNKKVYITVNNLMNHEDLEQAKDYLLFLNEANPDGLIIQDFALFQLIHSLNIHLPLHASVMMNVHNLPMIKELDKLGVERIVLSREMDLKTVQKLHQETPIELEYFTHGDMCVCHGAQCLYSGILFGMSSNRGRCLKPCRWGYKIRYKGKQYPTKYPLAVKDMCMLEHLPEMIAAGITSFKIEGRMRNKEFITDLINIYGDALDRYIEDPINYQPKGLNRLIESRKRDLSTGYAFGKPGLKNINTRYEGTGKMYSSGKMFSTPTKEPSLSFDRIKEIQSKIKEQVNTNHSMQNNLLSVKVHTLTQGQVALDLGVDRLYLSGEIFMPNIPYTTYQLKDFLKRKGNTKVYLAFPRMMNSLHFNHYDQLFNETSLDIDGLMVTNLGALAHYRSLGIKMIGDYSLNIYNHLAADYYKDLGLDEYTLSLESPLTDFLNTITKSNLPTEIIVQGHPSIMYLEHDLYENIECLSPEPTHRPFYATDHLVLKTGKNELPVLKDQFGRNHILTEKELSLLPIIDDLKSLNIHSYRIESCFYDDLSLGKIIKLYQHSLRDSISLNPKAIEYKKCTLGALNFD